jgi:predicted Zn-dependent protease
MVIISTTRNQSRIASSTCKLISAALHHQSLLSLTVFCLLMPWQLASAHGDLEEQIAAITAEIRKQPMNAVLYLRRGELHRLHKEADEALADYAEAARLKPDSVMPALYRAQLFCDMGRTQDAIAEANSVLKRDPVLPEALLIRARCNVKLGAIREAVLDLSAALAKWTSPQPELYLERAQLQAALGHLDDAVKGLEAGMAKIGETPPLQTAAIAYERQQAKFDAALARVEKITQQYSVKESWLLLQGEILAQAGRAAEARVAFETVLADIEKYPPARRNLDQTKQFEARARDALARADAKLAQSSR